MRAFTLILLISLLVFVLGCVGKPPEGTPTPTPSPTPTPIQTPLATSTPIVSTPTPTPTPTPTRSPETFLVYADTDRGFFKIRALNNTVDISRWDVLNISILVNDKVRWINDDSYDFYMTILSQEGLWTNRTGYLRYNETSFEYAFNRSGVFHIYIKEYLRLKNQTITVR